LPRVDDFLKALALAREILPTRDPAVIGRNAGAEFLHLNQGEVITLPFFTKPVTITYPEGQVEYEESEAKLSLQEQGLILHYLLGAQAIPLTNELITFREVPSGEFYYQPFLKRAQVPLVQTFGSDHELFRRAGQKLGGIDAKMGDVSLTFRPFPRTPITLILWKEDEEFPPEGNILFDAGIKHFLAGEDIAFLAGTVVYKLMAIANSDKRDM
jgi:hypothetical protein